MRAPILKVSPNVFDGGPIQVNLTPVEAGTEAPTPPSIQHSLRAFATIVSSTVPGTLQQSVTVRAQMRSQRGRG